MNSVTLSGYIITEPKMIEGSKRAVCSFFLETGKTWTETKGGEKVRRERFEQHYIVGLDKHAETFFKLGKVGSEVTVSGELTYNKFLDANGREFMRAEVVMSSFQLHGLRKFKAEEHKGKDNDFPWAGERVTSV